jgi:hypothetical protein
MSVSPALAPPQKDDGVARRSQDEQNLATTAVLEQPHDLLNKVAAGRRAATINKLLFDEVEAGIVLSVSTETLKLWRREGRGPVWVRLGDSKLIRYTIDALRNYVVTLAPGQDAARNNGSDRQRRVNPDIGRQRQKKPHATIGDGVAATATIDSATDEPEQGLDTE